MENITVQGTEVLVEGQGPQTVVCIHGWPDTHRLWDSTVEALKDQHRCVRFTLPGFEGPPQDRALSLAELTARLLAIVDAVSPGKPVTLLLHDWGCVFGYELAARHPERVARIVAVDIGDARSPEFLKSLSAKQTLMLVFYQVWLAKCWVLGRFVNARFANYSTRMMARGMRCPAPPDSIHWTMNYPYAMTWLGVGGGLRGLADFKPHCPVLYLYGQRKPFMFHSQQWLDKLNTTSGSKAVGMKTGHWVMLGQPQEFTAVVGRVATRHNRQRRAGIHWLQGIPINITAMSTAQGTQYALFEVAEASPLEKPSADTTERRFSDYVVYVDESGDHSLASIDPGYPVFVLALCVFHKRHYSEQIIPAVEKLKFNYFGHDSVVLHENEISKQKGVFAFLSHRPTRVEFMERLNSIMDASNFILIACVVDKTRLPRGEGTNSNPYHIALGICLEALHGFLAEKGQENLRTHVVVECRGNKEDRELELEFRRIRDGNNHGGQRLPYDIVFANKQTNLTGLQLADLVARPVGVNYIRPEQPNQAFELLKRKFYCDGGRNAVGIDYENVGLLIYPPQKAKSPDEPTEAITPTRNPQST